MMSSKDVSIYVGMCISSYHPLSGPDGKMLAGKFLK